MHLLENILLNLLKNFKCDLVMRKFEYNCSMQLLKTLHHTRAAAFGGHNKIFYQFVIL